jgi:hypothetical protein
MLGHLTYFEEVYDFAGRHATVTFFTTRIDLSLGEAGNVHATAAG